MTHDPAAGGSQVTVPRTEHDEQVICDVLAAHQISRTWPYPCLCGNYEYEEQAPREHIGDMLFAAGVSHGKQTPVLDDDEWWQENDHLSAEHRPVSQPRRLIDD